MRSSQSSTRSAGVTSASEVVFFMVLFLFLTVVCVWPILTWRLHHFSTWEPDSAHSYAVRDHGGFVYLKPALGKFYVSLPWLWGGLLAATVFTGLLGSRKPGSKT